MPTPCRPRHPAGAHGHVATLQRRWRAWTSKRDDTGAARGWHVPTAFQPRRPHNNQEAGISRPALAGEREGGEGPDKAGATLPCLPHPSDIYIYNTCLLKAASPADLFLSWPSPSLCCSVLFLAPPPKLRQSSDHPWLRQGRVSGGSPWPMGPPCSACESGCDSRPRHRDLRVHL